MLLQVLGLANTVQAASKIDMSAGYFSIASQTSRASGSIANFGVYTASYRYEVYPQVELGVGYSIAAAKTFTGDLAFGPDFGANYYPVTSAGPRMYETGGTQFVFAEKLRPYVGVGFHQRQYQSSQSTYAGFSLVLGGELAYEGNLSFTGSLRMLSLIGPSNAKATELNLFAGLAFSL